MSAIEATRARLAALEEHRFVAERDAVPPCPWCLGRRRSDGTRLHCLTPSCRTIGGVQAEPLTSRPQPIVFFFAPRTR